MGAGKLDEKYASRLIQWRALRPTADQALPGPQLWCEGTTLAPSLSHLPGYPTHLALGRWRRRRRQWGWDGEHPKEGLQLLGPLYTRNLAILDICNDLPADGFSYAKYFRTYGGPACQGRKSFFPYEYVDNLVWLCDPLPPYKAFYSSLCSVNTLKEGLGLVHGQWNYTELCWLWVCKGMTSLCDLLVHYNNCEVVPFLTALQRQCDLYKVMELDSIGMSYGMHGSEGLFHDQAKPGWPGGTDEDGHRARTFHRVQATRGGWPHHYADAWLRHRDVPLSCSGWLWCQFTPPVCHDTGHAHRAWQVWSELGYGLNDEGTSHSYGQCHSKASL